MAPSENDFDTPALSEKSQRKTNTVNLTYMWNLKINTLQKEIKFWGVGGGKMKEGG